eukprot:ANDGO_05599.mRNA.1 hypothetical protein
MESVGKVVVGLIVNNPVLLKAIDTLPANPEERKLEAAGESDNASVIAPEPPSNVHPLIVKFPNVGAAVTPHKATEQENFREAGVDQAVMEYAEYFASIKMISPTFGSAPKSTGFVKSLGITFGFQLFVEAAQALPAVASHLSEDTNKDR